MVRRRVGLRLGCSNKEDHRYAHRIDRHRFGQDQAMHRVRDRLVQRRTALINEIRGFLLERGITFAAQPIHLRKNLPAVIEDAEQNLSPRLRWLLDRMWQEWKQSVKFKLCRLAVLGGALLLRLMVGHLFKP